MISFQNWISSSFWWFFLVCFMTVCQMLMLFVVEWHAYEYWAENIVEASGHVVAGCYCILQQLRTVLDILSVLPVCRSTFQMAELRYCETRIFKITFVTLRHCATSRKVAGSIPQGVIGIFNWHNSSDRTMALGSTQALIEMSTRLISWGVKAAGA
jgi:hypothetical protein